MKLCKLYYKKYLFLLYFRDFIFFLNKAKKIAKNYPFCNVLKI